MRGHDGASAKMNERRTRMTARFPHVEEHRPPKGAIVRATEGLRPGRLWSLWEIVNRYTSIYDIALALQNLRNNAEVYRTAQRAVDSTHDNQFRDLLERMAHECTDHGWGHISVLANNTINRAPMKSYAEMYSALNIFDDSIRGELERESVFRISPERKHFYEQDNLFGSKVSTAFPSCARDIRKAGSCYALAQEDACVHHLMLVLERGLNTLAAKVGVPYQRSNWQDIINQVGSQLKSMPRGAMRDFYLEVNAQFGFLKDAYRNHSQHARDDYYDMEKALSILNHVRAFMQALEKEGLKE